MGIQKWGWLWLGLWVMVACQAETVTPVTREDTTALFTPVPISNLPTAVPTAAALVPSTWTPIATALRPIELFTAPPTWTPRATLPFIPTNTRPPTATATPIPPTETPSATPPITILTPFFPPPTNTPPPTGGGNLLPNPSFENGWYNLNNTPELQVPNEWWLEWEVGDNPLDPDPWNDFVRPETRVLPKAFLPAHEHSTYIWDGTHTVKVFKGEGAISFRLMTQVYLEAGQYVMEANIYPDLVVGYRADGSKIWAPDPLSGEVQFVVDGSTSGWQLPIFGRRNTITHVFTVAEPHTLTLGVWIRGRWAIENNGWFMDAWSLRRVVE